MRQRDHIAGEEFAVEFELFDARDRSKFSPPITAQKYVVQVPPLQHLSRFLITKTSWLVSILTFLPQIFIGSRMLYMDSVFAPGYFRFRVPCPPIRVSTVLKVRVTNEHGQAFEDSFTIDVNAQFYRIIKVLPPFFSLRILAMLMLPL